MKVDDRIAARARKNHTALLSALAETGQGTVASLIGESDTTVSRFKGDLERCAALMAACGLKVVPATQRFYSEERIRALNVLARIGLDADPTSDWGSLGD